MVTDYTDLTVWRKAMELVTMIYELTRALPEEEKYGLSGQMKRAAVSIPSNIAEGHGRNTTKEYVRFLCIAKGSRNELETQLLLCKQLGFLTEQQIALPLAQCGAIAKMLNALIKALHRPLPAEIPDPEPPTPDP